MSDIHQITYEVRPHDADYGKEIKPFTLLNYLQDAAYGHSVSLGFSARDLFKKGLTWVLSRYHIQVERFPVIGEKVTVRTWYPGPQKPFYLRDWEVLADDGNVLVRATSSWLILDMVTMKPADDEGLLDRLEPRPVRAIEDDFNTLPELVEAQWETRFSVRLSDTDLNRHVNHVHYIQWALESITGCVPERSHPGTMEAGYRAEVRFGDTVIARAREAGEGVFHHKLLRESDGRELTRLRTKWNIDHDS